MRQSTVRPLSPLHPSRRMLRKAKREQRPSQEGSTRADQATGAPKPLDPGLAQILKVRGCRLGHLRRPWGGFLRKPGTAPAATSGAAASVMQHVMQQSCRPCAGP